MINRPFGATGFSTLPIGLGCWQLGNGWDGAFDQAEAIATMDQAVESGVRFFDTADVYSDGESEAAIGRFLKTKREQIFVATKIGRRSEPGWPENFTSAAMHAHVEATLRRLQVSTIDLLQLHCIPPAVLAAGEVFETLRNLRQSGKIRFFGASVESVEEGLTCLAQPGCASLQVILNILRQKPLDVLLPAAQRAGVAIIVRLPLASGLLTGKLRADTVFNATDHRSFNRDGAAFNVGETFAGLPYAVAIELIEQLRSRVPAGMSMADMSLRWLLDQSAVSVVIPGASRAPQIRANVAVAALPPLPPELHAWLRIFYREKVVAHIRGPN